LIVVILCLDAHHPTTLAHWLRSADIRVEIAASGWQVRQLLRSGGSCVLVTDRVIPPWPGLSRLSSLKTAYRHLRVATVDRGDADSRYVAWAAGADAVISPPLRRDIAMRAIAVAQGSG
jgi:DNA-binding response OmpR family regulator